MAEARVAAAAAAWPVDEGEELEEDESRRRRRRRKEEIAVVVAAVATAVVLIERFIDDHRLLVLPGNAAAALQSSMQATAVALAKLQAMYATAGSHSKATRSSTIPTRFGLDSTSTKRGVDDDEDRDEQHREQSPWSQLVDADDHQWRDSFRMSRCTFLRLLETLGPVLQRQDTNMKDAIPADKKLAAALYRLAHGATFKIVARKFGIGASSCCKAFYEVCKGLEEKLGHLFDFPSSAHRVQAVSDGFTLLGMPNCCGVIGCTNFSVERPLGDAGIEYLDHGRNYSVVMQGVVDSASRFLDISVGWPGCYPPAAILVKTRFYSRIQDSRELLHGPSLDLGTGFPIPQYVLGDQAYPLHPWLVTPYADDGSDHRPLQALFNKAHREAMSPARRAFGMLKEQWQLLKTKQRADNIELMPFIVAAACVLQNFLIDHGEPMPSVEEAEVRDRVPLESENVYGEGVRSGLASFISQCHSAAGIQ